jgi:hypothetical protein
LNTRELKNYFCRHFLGQVKVNSLSVGMEVPQILSCKRDVSTHQIRWRIKTAGTSLFGAKSLVCSSRSFRFSPQFAKARGGTIASYALGKSIARAVPKLRAVVRENMARVSVLPQERGNRLQCQSVRPKKNDEIILAWFGPIVEDAVVKLSLNKQRGSLLIWYNPQSRRFDSRGLYLYRRLGLRDSLEWRWL